MPKKLLWFDALGGLYGACYTLLLHSWLTSFYRMPENVLWMTGGANLLYGLYSGSLALRQRSRPVGLIVVLAIANALWAVVCAVLWTKLRQEATIFGLIHLVLEGAIVAVLAVLEWRYREALVLPARITTGHRGAGSAAAS